MTMSTKLERDVVFDSDGLLAEVEIPQMDLPFIPDNNRLGASNEEPLSDSERGFQILIEATRLYKSLLLGVVLSHRNDILKDVAETTGVSPSILLYATRFGTLRAHHAFTRFGREEDDEQGP